MRSPVVSSQKGPWHTISMRVFSSLRAIRLHAFTRWGRYRTVIEYGDLILRITIVDGKLEMQRVRFLVPLSATRLYAWPIQRGQPQR